MVGSLIKGKYIPIKFSPYDYPLMYQCYDINSDVENLNNKIGEFIWTGKKWKLIIKLL